VLSWSVLDAMACGCVVLGSDTAPVREVITAGKNGLLRGFNDVDGLVDSAVEVLEDPSSYRELGAAAQRTVAERYSLETVLPRMLEMYQETIQGDA
jgi:glycosyltransferase involved in cell wall biosynthesis